jgi:Na+-driven multidrug efflux pump
VLALIIPVNVTGAVCGVWLVSLHRDRLLVTIAAVAGVANVVFGCLLLLLFGPIGMAWSVIAAEAVGAAGGFLAVRRDARRAEAAGPPMAEVESPGQPRAAASR